MKILYFRPDTVDCTADPHYVNYGDIEQMLTDVQKVLESSLVQSITSVNVYDAEGSTLLESDSYSTWSGSNEERKKAEGEYAKKHKVEGLYFISDAKDERKIPVGLSGYRHLVEMVIGNKLPKKVSMEDIGSITIGIAWAFTGDHNCSDYITINPGSMTVDYCNQDWYTDHPGYHKHCQDLSNLIGYVIEPND